MKKLFQMLVTTLIFTVVLGDCCGSAQAQPFGVAQGTPISALHLVRKVGEFFFEITPASQHPSFESYTVLATPQDGVCSIHALGITLKNDAYGSAVRDTVHNLETQLNSKYGISKIYDYLRVGSIWRDSHDWAMGVYKKERTYARVWTKQDGSNLPPDIESIVLEAKSLGSDATYVVLTYDFSNYNKCATKKNGIGAGAL